MADFEELTLEVFNQNNVVRKGTPGFIEKAWFRWEHALGIVLVDLDELYSFVVLSKDPEGVYRAVDLGCNYATMDDVRRAMKKAMKFYKDQAVVDQGPPVETPEEAGRIFLNAQRLAWAQRMALLGFPEIGASVAVDCGHYMAIVHPSKVEPMASIVLDPDTPVEGPFDTEEAAKKAGSAILTQLMADMKDVGWKSHRTKN